MQSTSCVHASSAGKNANGGASHPPKKAWRFATPFWRSPTCLIERKQKGGYVKGRFWRTYPRSGFWYRGTLIGLQKFVSQLGEKDKVSKQGEVKYPRGGKHATQFLTPKRSSTHKFQNSTWRALLVALSVPLLDAFECGYHG